MRYGSLRLRLLAGGAASILVALAIAGLGLLLLFERHVERRMALELEAGLRQLVSGLERAADGTIEVARPPADPRFEEPLGGLYWQITAAAGQPELRSRSVWDDRLALPDDSLLDGELHQHTIVGPAGTSLLVVERSVLLPAALGGVRIRAAVAADRAEIHRAGLAFASDLAPSLGLLAAVLVAAAWVQVTIGLRPLDAVRRRLAEVRAGEAARLGSAFPREVLPLAAEVDHLLGAQEQAIARARSRAADLAHGLKSPLTVLGTDAELLRRRGEADLADEIATLADGMRRHVERELARARAGAGMRTEPRPIRPVVDDVVAVLRRAPRKSPLAWEIDVPAGLALEADPQDLAEILGNLVENAGKWARSTVRITASAGPGELRLTVEDDGPGVPEAAIGTAIARGGRLDESQPGSGLGLAIVGDLLEVYDGSLSLGRSALGGLCAEIRLPARAGLRRPASVR